MFVWPELLLHKNDIEWNSKRSAPLNSLKYLEALANLQFSMSIFLCILNFPFPFTLQNSVMSWLLSMGIETFYEQREILNTVF